MAIVGKPPPTTPPGPTATGAALDTAAGGAVGTAAAATFGSPIEMLIRMAVSATPSDDADGDAECEDAACLGHAQTHDQAGAAGRALGGPVRRAAASRRAVEDAGIGLADGRVRQLLGLGAFECPCRATG